jgi:hypothetical protein
MPPRRELERRKFRKVQESSETRFGITYSLGNVTLESAGIDLNIGTASTNSSALKVTCGPAEKSAEILRIALELWSSYAVGGIVALECAVVDLYGTFINKNSTALGVACPRQTWKKIQEDPRDHHSSTYGVSSIGVES